MLSVSSTQGNTQFEVPCHTYPIGKKANSDKKQTMRVCDLGRPLWRAVCRSVVRQTWHSWGTGTLEGPCVCNQRPLPRCPLFVMGDLGNYWSSRRGENNTGLVQTIEQHTWAKMNKLELVPQVGKSQKTKPKMSQHIEWVTEKSYDTIAIWKSWKILLCLVCVCL